jgi:hypothetical protein
MSELTITEPIMPGSMLDLATREVERLSGPLAAAEPVPCRGAQGLWTLPADVEAQVMGQVGR